MQREGRSGLEGTERGKVLWLEDDLQAGGMDRRSEPRGAHSQQWGARARSHRPPFRPETSLAEAVGSVCCTFYPAFPSPFPPPPAGVGAGIRARLALAHDAGRREEAQKALCEAAPSSFWALEPARCEWAADKGIAADRVPVIGAVASLRGTKRRRMAAT